MVSAVALLVAALWLAVCPGTAGAALPVLGETNVITAAAPGYVDVVAPRPFNPFTLEIFKTYKATGEGEVKAFHLRKLGPFPESKGAYAASRPGFKWLSLGPPGQEAESAIGSYGLRENGRGPAKQFAAGIYRLTFQSTKPATMRFSIPEFDGHTDLTLVRPAEIDAGYLPLVHPPLQGTLAWGRVGTNTVNESLDLYLRLDAPPDATADRMEACAYDANPIDPPPGAYLPGCPNARSPELTRIQEQGAWGVVFHFIFFDLSGADRFGSGRWGLGGNIQHIGLGISAWAIGYWNRVDDTSPVTDGTPVDWLPPIPTAASPPPPRGNLTVQGARFRVRRGRATIAVRCTAEGPCEGGLRIGRGREATLRLPAGRKATIRVRVPVAQRRRLRKRATITAMLTTRSATATGQRISRSRVTLRRTR